MDVRSCPVSQRSDGTEEVRWHDRSEPLPPTGQVWASDGKTVWLIWADGKPLPDYATAVKVWSPALIPKPPNMETFLVVHGGGSRLVRSTVPDIEYKKQLLVYQACGQVFRLSGAPLAVMRVEGDADGPTRVFWVEVTE